MADADRQTEFYLDHEMMLDFGEGLPTYLPPVNKGPYVKGENEPEHEEPSITVRYLTPHQNGAFTPCLLNPPQWFSCSGAGRLSG